MLLRLFWPKKKVLSNSAPTPESFNPNEPLSAEFAQIAQTIYSHLGLPLAETEKALPYLFSPQNSFFESAKACVLVEPGKARVAGFFSPTLRVNQKKTAFFGFWETQNDLSTNQKLFAQIENWARKQGAEMLYGPVQFSTFGRYRLQLSHYGEGETFDQEPYNPEYYAELLDGLGFKLDQTYSTYRSTEVEAIRSAVEKMAGKAFHLESDQFRIQTLTEEYVNRRSAELLAAINDIFSDNFAFTPIDEKTFRAAFGKRFLDQICPKTSFIVENQSGAIAALCICYHRSAPVDTLYVKTVGITKAFRGQGISLVHVIREILARTPSCRQVVLCLMRKGNFPSLLMQDFVQEEKTYGLFSKKL